MPRAWATILTSAPMVSQILAISLMKLIFVDKKELLAYLIISAVSHSVSTTGIYMRTRPVYIFLTMLKALLVCAPTTILSGWVKSYTAFPSAKNSGFETTSTSDRGFIFLMRRWHCRAVPGGTVLFLINSL